MSYQEYTPFDAHNCNEAEWDNTQLYYLGSTNSNLIQLTGESYKGEKIPEIQQVFVCDKEFMLSSVFNLPYFDESVIKDLSMYVLRILDKAFKKQITFEQYNGPSMTTMIIQKKDIVIKYSKILSAVESELTKYKQLIEAKVPLPILYTAKVVEYKYNEQLTYYCMATQYAGKSLWDELKNKIYSTDIKLFFELLYKLEQLIIYVYNLGYYQSDNRPFNYLVSSDGFMYFIDVDSIELVSDKTNSISGIILDLFFPYGLNIDNGLNRLIRQYILPYIKADKRKDFIDQLIHFIVRHERFKSRQEILADFNF